MTATAMSVTGIREEHGGLDRLTLWLLLAFVGATQVSIALAQILLAATALAWLALLVRDRTRPAAPRFLLPLALYGGATLVSAAFSPDPWGGLIDSKQLLLFAIVPLVYDLARGSRAPLVADVIVTVGATVAAVGIVQYAILHYDNLGQRPQGTLSHYMTYSGVLMLVICTAAARLVFGRSRTWPALIMPAVAVALSLTFTRSAWVGACVGVALLFILRDFRLTGLLPVLIAVAFAIAPDSIVNRMVSMFDLHDPTNRDRLAMGRAGAAMVADHPLVGVGPNRIPVVYPQYRDAGAVQASNPHLHNVPLQIAAERGLPALAIWLWFMAMLSRGLFVLFRQRRDRDLPAAAMAGIAAMLAAGLFEYNFGDSEFLMLFLVIVTLPFAAARSDAAGAATPAAPRP